MPHDHPFQIIQELKQHIEQSWSLLRTPLPANAGSKHATYDFKHKLKDWNQNLNFNAKNSKVPYIF